MLDCPLYKRFEIIFGTSTGAIIAALLVSKASIRSLRLRVLFFVFSDLDLEVRASQEHERQVHRRNESPTMPILCGRLPRLPSFVCIETTQLREQAMTKLSGLGKVFAGQTFIADVRYEIGQVRTAGWG